jgi:hypothetical protein
MRPYRRLVLRAALTALAAVALAAPADRGQPPPLRVLFVGNSLTAANDLPAYVGALAAARGRVLEAKTLAPGGYALEDHWNAGVAPAELAQGGWDVVVMQQGPSALPESEANLKLWATRFADAARAVGTTPALLTVWPESYRAGALGAVIGSYRRSAQAAGAVLLPAGDAWRAAWSCRRAFPLYGPDGFHPSRLGTYLAAVVVWARLFHDAPARAASNLRPYGAPFSTTPRNARLARASAASALGTRTRCP